MDGIWTSSRRVRRAKALSRARTGGRAEALSHLGKATEFLEAAAAAVDHGWYNAAASNAVTAGINAKDSLCFALVGQSAAADDHKAAVKELREASVHTREAAADLDRLVAMKDRAQYDRRDVTASDAKAALRRAKRLVGLAEETLSSR